MRSFAIRLGLVVLGCLAAACSADVSEGDDAPAKDEDLTSTDGVPLEFRFEADVIAARETPAKNAVVAQLEYLTGVLTTGSRANAQFRFVDIQNVTERNEGEAKKKIHYSGSVAVIFPAGSRVPTRYDLAVPLDVTDLATFNAKYDGRCGTNEYGRETFWHDFNPKAQGCTMDADVMKMRANVRRHPLGTTDKYPEYDKVWADGRLDMVAVYGAISDTTDNDTGARDREAFLTKVKDSLTNGAREDVAPRGGILKHSIVTGKKRIGNAERDVRLVAYFVSEAQSAGTEFMTSYGAETKKADLIVYSGHSGLGKNIAALAKGAEATAGKYQIAFFNGCQTWGYLGPWMHEKRTALNGAQNDPHGTKFLDVIVTTLPAYSESTPTEQVLFDALVEQRKGWQDILRLFSNEQWNKHLTSVFGEDDNTFRP
jgi:hypothetical protein